jgi:pre-mRNA-splicing factor 38A
VRAPHPRGCPPQIQPDKEIIIELIKNEEYKYVRALGAFYMRLVGKVR